MAAVIPLMQNPTALENADAPGKVLSLRSRLFERALEEAWAERLAGLEAEERETAYRRRQFGPRRLRVVR